MACHIEAKALDGRRRAVLIEGRDGYGFTAEALAEIATRMAQGSIEAVGHPAVKQMPLVARPGGNSPACHVSGGEAAEG